jgi:hypothetical protein
MHFNVWFRKHQKKIYVFLGVIIMITWFIATPIEQLLAGAVSKGGMLYGEKVKLGQVQDVMVRLQSVMGRQPNVDPEASAWAHIMLLKEAQRFGVGISSDEANEIAHMQFRSPSGGFDEAAYARFLRGKKVTAKEYEQTFRELLEIQKLQRAVAGSVNVSEDEAWNWYALENEQVKVKYGEVAAEGLLNLVSCTDEELRKFHEERMFILADKTTFTEGYKIPEKIKVEYLLSPYAPLMKDVVLTQQMMEHYYEANKTQPRFRKPEVRAAGSEAETPPSYMTFDEARSLIEADLRRQGAQELAQAEIERVDKAVSEQLSSAFGSTERKDVDLKTFKDKFPVEYGETDFFSADKIPASLMGGNDFKEKAFGQKDADIRVPRTPVTCTRGPVIFQLLGIQPERPSAYEEVKGQVEADLKMKKALELAENTVRDVLKAPEAQRASYFDKAVAEIETRLAALAPKKEAVPPAEKKAESADVEKKSEGEAKPAVAEKPAAASAAEAPKTRYVMVGESNLFTRPRQGPQGMTKYGTGLPGNRGEFARVAFDLNVGDLSCAFEPHGRSAAYLLTPMELKMADKSEFEKKQDQELRTVEAQKQRQVMMLWQSDIIRRAAPSEPVRQKLMTLDMWKAPLEAEYGAKTASSTTN